MKTQRTIIAHTTEDFDGKCNKLLSEGWERLGLPVINTVAVTNGNAGGVHPSYYADTVYFQIFEK